MSSIKNIIHVLRYDYHVWSENKSYLNGARENIDVDVSGHTKVIFDKKVSEIVLKKIEEF